jgi:hypothetical protein|tara:strand:- start:28 stop:216 length:189 start_codon:yes stop_codon:yes gene_type:complete
MKVGDLVKFNAMNYPQYKGMAGVLTRRLNRAASSTPWAVLINGKMHSFHICEEDMEVISESR